MHPDATSEELIIDRRACPRCRQPFELADHTRDLAGLRYHLACVAVVVGRSRALTGAARPRRRVTPHIPEDVHPTGASSPAPCPRRSGERPTRTPCRYPPRLRHPNRHRRG